MAEAPKSPSLSFIDFIECHIKMSGDAIHHNGHIERKHMYLHNGTQGVHKHYHMDSGHKRPS